eukprot:jgi/Chrzof1/4372/Cz14g10220.t1
MAYCAAMSKANPYFKCIQIHLYDPLRIQHESLTKDKQVRADAFGRTQESCIPVTGKSQATQRHTTVVEMHCPNQMHGPNACAPLKHMAHKLGLTQMRCKSKCMAQKHTQW